MTAQCRAFRNRLILGASIEIPNDAHRVDNSNRQANASRAGRLVGRTDGKPGDLTL